MKIWILSTITLLLLCQVSSAGENRTPALVFYGVAETDAPADAFPMKILQAEHCEITPDTVWITRDGEEYPFARNKVQFILRRGEDPAAAIAQFPGLEEEIREGILQWQDTADSNEPAAAPPQYIYPPGSVMAVEEDVQNITLRDGSQVSGITKITRDPDGLNVTHAAGITKIPFEQLPEQLLGKYEIDRDRAARYREEGRQARLQVAQARAEAARRQRETLANLARQRKAEKEREAWAAKAIDGKWHTIDLLGPKCAVIDLRIGKPQEVDWSSTESFVTLREQAKELVYGSPVTAIVYGTGIGVVDESGTTVSKLYPVQAVYMYYSALEGRKVGIPVYATSLDEAMHATQVFAETGKLPMQ